SWRHRVSSPIFAGANRDPTLLWSCCSRPRLGCCRPTSTQENRPCPSGSSENPRSEERRVGKESISRSWFWHEEDTYISTHTERASPCFFSSRRRHTRLQGDWSSDVCSSDLSWRHRVSSPIFAGATRDPTLLWSCCSRPRLGCCRPTSTQENRPCPSGSSENP